MNHRLGKLAAVATIALVASSLGLSGASAVPVTQADPVISPRISQYSITITPSVVRAGKAISMEVSGVFNTKSCAVTLIQGSKTSKARLVVRSYTAKGKATVPASFRGSTVARVACGKDGTATSSPFMVVGPTEPTSASCVVLEHGFSVSQIGYAELGLRMRNNSPTLSADDVEVAVTYRDASRRVIKTDTIYLFDGIPPAKTIILSATTDVGDSAASVSLSARCDTAMEAAPPVLPASASIVEGDYSSDVVGEMTNTLSKTIDRFSDVHYLVRNPSGRIIGGGATILDSFVSPGGIGTWEDYVSSGLPYVPSDRVEANVFVDFED